MECGAGAGGAGGGGKAKGGKEGRGEVLVQVECGECGYD